MHIVYFSAEEPYSLNPYLVNLYEKEYGISPGQACVFYKKNNYGYKVLGGGWIN